MEEIFEVTFELTKSQLELLYELAENEVDMCQRFYNDYLEKGRENSDKGMTIEHDLYNAMAILSEINKKFG